MKMPEKKLQIKVQIDHLSEWRQALEKLEKAAAEMQTALDQLNQLDPLEVGTISRKDGFESNHAQPLPSYPANC